MVKLETVVAGKSKRAAKTRGENSITIIFIVFCIVVLISESSRHHKVNIPHNMRWSVDEALAKSTD